MKQKLDELLYTDGIQDYMSLKIFDLTTHIKRFESSLVKDMDKLNKAYKSLFNSIWKASIIFDKIEFNRHLLNNGIMVKIQYGGFVRTDIEHFHTIVDSSMNYLIAIMSEMLIFKTKIDNFNTFLIHLAEYKDDLGTDIFELLNELSDETSWYKKLKRVRNHLVHRGAETMVFFNDGQNTAFEINFNKGKKAEQFIFEEYAVEHYVEYLYFLHKLGLLLEKKIKPIHPQSKFRITGQGLKVLKSWADR